MELIDRAIRYFEISNEKIKEINHALKLTTYEPSRKLLGEQLNALLWVNELVMSKVREEEENDHK